MTIANSLSAAATTLFLLPLTSLCGVAAAQEGGEQGLPSVLSKSEQQSLNRKLRDWFKETDKRQEAEDRDRNAERARQAEQRAKDKFLEEFEARSKAKKVDLLTQIGDLKEIFHGAFTVDRQSGSGDIRSMKVKDGADYHAVIPRGYRNEDPYPTVLAMRGWNAERSIWTNANDWFETTWKGVEAPEPLIVVYPDLPDSLDFDRPVDMSRPEGAELRYGAGKRLETVLGTLGSAGFDVNIDRDRIFYDCAKGSCRFGLRLATFSPHTFAGLILRHPEPVGDLRLESLTGVPVLLISSADTKEACDSLAKSLNGLKAGACTVIEGKGEYPFHESGAEIAAWVVAQKRDLFRKRVVIANTDDNLTQGFWVKMGQAPVLASVPPDKRPFLDVEADRAANRISVKAVNVNSFGMYLNDALVDLDKEITVIVNGRALPSVKLVRSLQRMCDYVGRMGRDPGFLFPAETTVEIPEEALGNGSEPGK